jgi:hypothetical protein
MSFNRLRYDDCAYNKELTESVGTLSYILDPSRYENCNKCRMELGIIGGTNVSHIQGNLVDLETDLRGTTRMSSKCPTKKYANNCPKSEDMTSCQPDSIVLPGNAGNKTRRVDTSFVHLPACQMIRYKPIPLEPEMVPVLCPTQDYSNANNVNNTNNSRNTNNANTNNVNNANNSRNANNVNTSRNANNANNSRNANNANTSNNIDNTSLNNNDGFRPSNAFDNFASI